MKTNRVVKLEIRKKGYGTLFCQFCFYIDINITSFSERIQNNRRSVTVIFMEKGFYPKLFLISTHDFRLIFQ